MVCRTEPRRLLHIFSTFAVGGPQIRFCSLANALGRTFRHTIVAMDGNLNCVERLDEGVCWDTLCIRAVKSHGISFSNLRRFRKVLSSVNPDLILTYNWGALEWALANRFRPRAPHIHFEDGFGADESPTLQLRRRVYLRKLALGPQSRVVVPSRTLWDVGTKRWGFSPERLLLIPNGINCDRFDEPPDRSALRRLGIYSDGLVIGTITALRPEKNLARLIGAFGRLGADFRGILVIVGEGDERIRLQNLAASSEVASRIYFVGFAGQPEALFRSFDIFAMSSDTEQMPLSLLEAMASGLPVVATDVGDIVKIISPANRPLVQGCLGEKALSRALAMLASDPVLREELGKQNQERARREFDLAGMVDRYRELFEAQVIDPHKRSRFMLPKLIY